MTTAIETRTRFSEPEMDAAFKRVCDPDDWRAPINCVIRLGPENDLRELELIAEAVMFYAANKVRFVRLKHRTYRVTADGYRAGPAGP